MVGMIPGIMATLGTIAAGMAHPGIGAAGMVATMLAGTTTTVLGIMVVGMVRAIGEAV